MTTIASSTIATDNDSYARFVLAQLECAGLRSRLMTCEIDSIAVALNGNLITTDVAIAWANEIGALDPIATSSSIITSTQKGTQNATTARNTGRAQSSGAETEYQGKHGRQ